MVLRQHDLQRGANTNLDLGNSNQRVGLKGKPDESCPFCFLAAHFPVSGERLHILDSGLQNGATDLCRQEGVERGGMH